MKLDDGINSGASIQCEGYQSCSDGKLYAHDGFIECTAYQSCVSSIIETPRYVYIDGEESAKQSMIFAPNVRIYGYYGSTKAVITSYNDTLSLKVRLEGELAGYDAYILCRSKSNCSVICESSGCKNLKYICFKGSDCDITPRECNRPIKKPKAVNGVNCPNITQNNLFIQTDEEILEFIRKNKDLKSFMALSSRSKDEVIDISSNDIILDVNNNEKENGHYMILFLVVSCLLFILAIVSYSGCQYIQNTNGESKHYQIII